MAQAQVTISVDSEGVLHRLEQYPDRVTRATIRAINRAIASARTVMVREIARDTGLRSKDVRDALSLREATVNHLSGSLGATLKKIPLIKFNARGPEPSRGKGRGVRARLVGGAGHYPHAFIVTMPTGHRGVFARKTPPSRLPIRELFGPSLGRVFEKYRAPAEARAREVFGKNLDHELEFAASQVVESADAGGSD